MPAVSVIVPNYNHARYLAQRLDSILGQTFTDFEVIVLDDASTDHSREVIVPYLRDPRVSFHPSKKNSGSPFFQWNRGLAMARAELVWIAESDDFAAPELLATLVPLLRGHDQLSLAYAQSCCVDAEGKPTESQPRQWLGPLDGPRWDEGFTRPGATECAESLLRQNTIPNASAVLLRREKYFRAGGAPTDMRLAGDWLVWARLLTVGDVAFVPKVLNFFRHHPASVRSATAPDVFQQETWRVRRFILKHVPVPALTREQFGWETSRDIIDRVARKPRAQRPGELLGCLCATSPILRGAPRRVVREFALRIPELLA